MAELRPNLGTYMKGERMMLVTKDGSIMPRDVTGQSPEYIGLLAEVLDFYSFVQKEKGISGFVERIGNLSMDGVLGQAFDYQKLIDTRQTINAIAGGGEGYDGDVFDPREKSLLLTNMSRGLTDDDQAIGWHSDQAGTLGIIQDMGLQDKDGRPNLEVISAYSAFAHDNLHGKFTRKEAQAHLHKLFPDLVKTPQSDENYI